MKLLVKLPAERLEWEPVVKQFIRIEKGIITAQGLEDSTREIRVAFLSKKNFQQFVSNLEDIEVEYVLEQ